MNSPGKIREIGTLIVVVLKGKNLPNKRSIGKQDPYCALQVGKEVRRTKPLKRGGQHPEWDEEVRFPIVEDTEDILVRTGSRDGEDGVPPPVPSKEPAKSTFNKKRKMRLSCYADDPREPELIGDISISLEDVLTKGETDEWYTLTNKERYCGEIYLEMTFWSNAKAPEKKPRPSVSDTIYGGPGSFTPSSEMTPERTGRTNAVGTGQRRPSRSPLPTYRSANEILPDFESSGRLPEALRPSTSLAKLDLYVAPYESRPSALSPSPSRGHAPYDEFGAETRRRESFPPAAEHRQHPSVPGTTQHSSSQGFHRIPSTSLADDMSNLSLQSSSSRPLPQATGASSMSRPAFYEPSYPSYTSNSSISSHQSQSTGASNFYTPRTSPSPMPQPASSGFVAPEQAEYQYNATYGRTSVSPGHTGPGGYFPQGIQPVYSRRTSDAGFYPPPQAVTPIPAQLTYTQTPPASLSRDSSFSSPHHQQTPPPLQQPQQLPYAPSTSPHNQPNVPSPYSIQGSHGSYDYAPQPTPVPYQTPHSHRGSLPPPPSSNSAPYVPSTTPQPQTHYGNGQFGTSPSIPYMSQQQPLEAMAPPLSHSAPPGPQYDHGGPGAPSYPTSTLPSPTGHRHGPRTSSSGSGSGRPLPNPQQHGHVHAHSQSITMSHSFGFNSAPTATVPTSASGQFHQSASFTAPLPAAPINGGLTPPPPAAPHQAQAPPPPQQPISAYEQFQQMQHQQHQPIIPQPEPGYSNGGPVPQPQRSQSLPPAPQAPASVPEQPIYNQQHQQQSTYATYSSSVYPSVPPPPPLPSSVSSIVPPPPPPLPPTTPPYQYQQTPQPGLYPPQPPSTYVPFSPPPPPPPLHS